MPPTDFARIPPQVDFPELDAEIARVWKETDAFAESIRRRPADREYTFYDGPPFTTGRPHYGNLLAGVIKDIVPRYWTMRGYRNRAAFRMGHAWIASGDGSAEAAGYQRAL